MSNTYRSLNQQQLMDQAITALRRSGVSFVRQTDFQLKVGAFNFYPGKGTIYRDGEISARKEKGLPAFLLLLRKAGLASREPVQMVDNPASFTLELEENDKLSSR